MPYFNSSLSHSVGQLVSWKQTEQGITGETAEARFRILFYEAGTIRITFTREASFEDFSYSIIGQTTETDFSVSDEAEYLALSTDQLRVLIRKNPLRITFMTPSGEVINEDDALGTSWIGDQVTTYKKLQDGERFIGLGEKTGPLDRKGHGYVNWNTDAYAYNNTTDPMYCSMPFYIGIHHHLLYGIYLDNTHKTFFNFGASNNRFSSFAADCGEMNYYFMHGNTIADILRSYTHLTGRMEMPPRWSLGYQQCRYSYYPDKEVLSVARTFREKDIPADAIVLDIHYMEKYKIFTWSKRDFPDPKGMMEKLQEENFQVVVMCDPGIKVEEGYDAYEDGKAKDVFIKYPDGDYYTGMVWPGWCHFPDFTKPETRQWWKEKLQQYTDLGIAGYWNDMNEIATWGNMLPELVEMDFEGHKATLRRGRNIYGMQMARSTYEGTKSLMNGKRPFNLTRSAFSGIQRYSAVWTGDNVAYDEHMLMGVRLVNSLGITGVAFCGYDIGGFVGNTDEKLFARWLTIGTFSPFFRGHTMINTRDSEPWSFGERVEEISRNYIKLRYRLMPYLYSLFYDASTTGMPINRTLAIDYPFDYLVYDHQFHNQYTFGPALLVAPVESSKDLVKVYLPEGQWYELMTDKSFHGNQVIVADCPLDRLPVYVKGSSIIPMREQAGSTVNDHGEVLEIHLYAGSTDNSFVFYDDDGETYRYQQGEYHKRKLEFFPGLNKFIVGKAEGNLPSVYSTLKVFFHGFHELRTVSVNGKPNHKNHCQFRYINTMASYDPIKVMPEGPSIGGLQFISIPNFNDELVITW
ncbi:MAG: glycoside hydrolase family 31 protein [Cyclobacteriaceae bacterium]|jgi:alpha-glucosidase|nr:glycoside hydrolase family 31 protein [Cyclobacteriaceae bacterium]